MVDWLDVGFNVLIGLVALGIICYTGWQVKGMIEKQIKEDKKERIDKELEDDLDDFLGV